jgi:hypothetical protein
MQIDGLLDLESRIQEIGQVNRMSLGVRSGEAAAAIACASNRSAQNSAGV